jgi:hypothetical protein
VLAVRTVVAAAAVAVVDRSRKASEPALCGEETDCRRMSDNSKSATIRFLAYTNDVNRR